MVVICSLCGCRFTPSANDEQPMRLGKIPTHCPKCVIKSSPVLPHTKRFVRRDPNATLERVDVFEPDGIIKRWMSKRPIPPKVEYERRRGRRADLHVFIMSASSGHVFQPRPHYIRTNLPWFQGRALNLKFWKDPSAEEALTGLAEIEIPREDVDVIEDNKGMEVIIRLKNKGWIRLQYKN